MHICHEEIYQAIMCYQHIGPWLKAIWLRLRGTREHGHGCSHSH